MPNYQAPLADLRFLLFDVWQAEQQFASLPNCQEASRELCDSILEESAKFAEQKLFPLNQVGDSEGCRLENGQVATPSGFKKAYQLYRENGWIGLTADPAFGGQGLPYCLGMVCEEMIIAANVSFSLYPGLTAGVAKALHVHGTDALKKTYLPKLISGEWSGVMCLTESHSGSDLSLLRTKATPTADGQYAISGTKIFITGGEHDLTENIIHMVLARLPDAPPGIKGISVFLVPKYLVNEKGELGARNGVYCGSIEHKMGIKGSATCVMNYDGATGYLIGDLHQGIQAMFTVMNIERLSIGMQGLALAEVAYQNAFLYARERLQGRAPFGARYPEKVADPIIVHPDVRRMLLSIKAFTEGARALLVFVGLQVDISKNHPENNARDQAQQLVELFTPVVKAFFTDYGFEACNLALQVFGGHGYISEWGMEQYVRDARIAQIYEGTNGIQAIDLVKRKVLANKGASMQLLQSLIASFIPSLNELPSMQTALSDAASALTRSTEYILKTAPNDPTLISAIAVDYLHLFSLTTITFMWAKMALAAKQTDTESLSKNKLATAQFFIEKILPRQRALEVAILNGSNNIMQWDEG